MPVPSGPKVGAPSALAPLRKIALEEHFGHRIVLVRDGDGWYETRHEAGVGHPGPEYFDLVQDRLLDFNTTRADRSAFSNDYPYEYYAEDGEFIDMAPNSENDRRKIAYGNAQAIYEQ